MSKNYQIACQKELNALYVDCKKALDKGRMIDVAVKTTATKTQPQLGYYWDVILPRLQKGVREHGNEMSLAEINQMLNTLFFCKVKTITWKDKTGVQHAHILKTPRSKSGASKDEMSQFIDQVIRWANTELGIFIPEPVPNPVQVSD